MTTTVGFIVIIMLILMFCFVLSALERHAEFVFRGYSEITGNAVSCLLTGMNLLAL
jgi:hypothetical protein